jgi:hypothetical protein
LKWLSELEDENISEIEIWRLHEWGFDVRQIEPGTAATGTSDENTVLVLHRLKHLTFFTRDPDFWNPRPRLLESETSACPAIVWFS